MVVVRILVVVAGAAAVASTLLSAIRTFVVPRATPLFVTRWVFTSSRALYTIVARRRRDYAERDRLMATYAPITLVVLPVVWLTIILVACMGMFWGLGVDSWRAAFSLSGASLFTLGFASPPSLPATVLSFIEATAGLGLLALLLAYLPAMYTAFARREAAVAMLEVSAGDPPTPEELLRRAWVIEWMDRLPGLWARWQEWFIDIEESHTSLAALSFFRSPQPQRSWVTAAACVLDTASIRASAFDLPRDPDSELCIRTGYLALRHIADYFAIPFNRDPKPDDPISVTREEFDEVIDRLAEAGMPVRSERDRVWRDWAGWRVNYDALVIGLAGLTMAPEAPWSSDRASPGETPPFRRGMMPRHARE